MYTKAMQTCYRNARNPLQRRLAIRTHPNLQKSSRLVAPTTGAFRALNTVTGSAPFTSRLMLAPAIMRQFHTRRMTVISSSLQYTIHGQPSKSLRTGLFSFIDSFTICVVAYTGLFIGILLPCAALILHYLTELCEESILYFGRLVAKCIKASYASVREGVAYIANLLKSPLGRLEECIVDNQNTKLFYVEGYSQGVRLAKQVMKEATTTIEPKEEPQYMLGWLQSIADYAEGRPPRKTASSWFWKNSDPYEQGYRYGACGKGQADWHVLWYTCCFNAQHPKWIFGNRNGLSGNGVYVTAFRQGIADGSRYWYRTSGQSR